MAKNKQFEINVPELPKNTSKNKGNKEKDNNVDDLKKSIKSQYDELTEFQDTEITEENEKDLERLILATEDLINNCMNDEVYSGNRDQYFVNLIFISHKMSLRLEAYKLEEKISELEEKNNTINENQKVIEEKQVKSEEQANNLVYNILGFIASFSIVSAAVTAIDKIENLENIMLFMAFTAFILITTLIGLNNFYKGRNDGNKKLQNNYFLWKMLIFVIVGIMLYKGIIFIKDNKNELFESIGRGIAMYQEHKEN